MERLAEHTDDWHLAYARGLAFEGRGNLGLARASYRRALERAESAQQKFRALQALQNVDQNRDSWETAERYALLGLELRPTDPVLLRTMAEIAFRRGQYDHSKRWIRRIPRDLWQNHDVEVLILGLYESGHYEHAQELTQNLLRHPKHSEPRARWLRLLGEITMKRGNYKAARLHLQEALELTVEPDDYLLRAAATASYRAQYYDESAALLERLGSRTISDEEFIANLWALDGQYERAVDHYRFVLRNVEGERAQRRILVALGNSYQAQGDHSRAVAVFRRAEGIRGDPEIITSLVDSLRRSGDEYEALEQSKRRLERFPSPEGKYELANLLTNLGYDEEALDRLQRSIDEGLPSLLAARAERQIAFAHRKRGRLEQAREHFRRALKIDAADPETLLALGETYIALKDYGAAIEHLELAYRSKPTRGVLNNLIEAYTGAGRDRLAIELVERLLATLPSGSAEAGGVLARLATLELRRGDSLSAAEQFQTAYEWTGATDPKLLAQAVAALIHAKKWAEAYKANQRLLQFHTAAPAERAAAAERQGVLAQRLGRSAEAIAHFQEAISLGREDWRIWQSLGFAQYQARRPDEALESFFESALTPVCDCHWPCL